MRCLGPQEGAYVVRNKVKAMFRWMAKAHKTRIIVFVFGALILLGALLLCLPAASRDGQSLPFVDALFTATSATCVTGLVVRDTFQHFTVFGQLVVLGLIQVGGLGFMAIATLFSLLLRRTISYNERLFIKETLNSETMQGLVVLMKRILLGTMIIELSGAALFAIRWVPEFGWATGIYKSIFQAISTFCNAGFDLMGQKGAYSSFTTYVTDPLVSLTACALIIVGGIGFFVWSDLLEFRKRRRLMLHSKIVLLTTAVLVVGGTVGFFLLEGHNPRTMLDLAPQHKWLASFFQSVTTRTAGINSIEQVGMTGAAKLLSVILMFIGGSPGSTAGGVKTATVFVLVATCVAAVRGSNQVTAFGRRLSINAVLRSLAIVFIGLLALVSSVVVIDQCIDASLIDILFECTSAFGTVGLGVGISGTAPTLPKLVLIALMFFGRVGIYTIVLALTQGLNSATPDKIRLPEEKIMVG